jgi:hypothetical protein
LAHFRHRSLLARSYTKVVGGCFMAARSTSLGVLQREQRISSHGNPSHAAKEKRHDPFHWRQRIASRQLGGHLRLTSESHAKSGERGLPALYSLVGNIEIRRGALALRYRQKYQQADGCSGLLLVFSMRRGNCPEKSGIEPVA